MKTKDPSALEDVQGPSQDANKHANLLYTIDPGGIICMHVVIKPMGYSRCAPMYGKCRLLR